MAHEEREQRQQQAAGREEAQRLRTLPDHLRENQRPRPLRDRFERRVELALDEHGRDENAVHHAEDAVVQGEEERLAELLEDGAAPRRQHAQHRVDADHQVLRPVQHDQAADIPVAQEHQHERQHIGREQRKRRRGRRRLPRHHLLHRRARGQHIHLEAARQVAARVLGAELQLPGVGRRLVVLLVPLFLAGRIRVHGNRERERRDPATLFDPHRKLGRLGMHHVLQRGVVIGSRRRPVADQLRLDRRPRRRARLELRLPLQLTPDLRRALQRQPHGAEIHIGAKPAQQFARDPDGEHEKHPEKRDRYERRLPDRGEQAGEDERDEAKPRERPQGVEPETFFRLDDQIRLSTAGVAG